MEIIARIRYNTIERKLVYAAELVANYEPLYDPQVDSRSK